MKPCPVCNTEVEDLYTGFCPNRDCTWEFEFVSEMTPEVLRRYEEKLRRAKRLYDNRSDKTYKDKDGNKDIENDYGDEKQPHNLANRKIFNLNLMFFLIQVIILIIFGILIHEQLESDWPTLKPVQVFYLIGHIGLFGFVLFNLFELINRGKQRLFEFLMKETICFIIGYLGTNIIFSLSESRWVVFLLIPLLVIVAVFYFFFDHLEDIIRSKIK